ncbi:cation-translocating P-type ATPase [Georgenia sp. Z1344]|uniref:cation-translocating P-type ATPase n=1 Tax=Georgenia sp. Z1344 TaxID=3416706 RepID=UPI003CFA3CDE
MADSAPPEPLLDTARPAITDPSVREPAEIADLLGVDLETGLSDAEAASRLEAEGPNELRGTPPTPWWRTLLAQLQDPLIYLLLVAIGISLVAWIADGASGAPVDAIVIAAVVVLNAVIGYSQEARAADAVAALGRMTAATSTVLREGRLVDVPSAELVRGDVLVLAEGDQVGADARVLTATALRIQEASLTGESEAVEKSAAALAEPGQIGDRTSMVHKGTAVAQGVGRAVVTATGMGTEMGAIADMLDRTESEPTPLEQEIAGVSRTLGIIVVVIAVVVMAAMLLVNGIETSDDLVGTLLLGVSLAVAAVPEGLPAILSLVLAIGVQRMASRKAVVKELHSVEPLGSATVICSDKTGTLTKNEMTIEQVVTASGTIEITGVGYRPEGEAVLDVASTAAEHEARLLLSAGSLANNAQLAETGGEWQIQGDPTEAAFLVAARKFPGVTDEAGRFTRAAEVPFTSERKKMSALEVDEDGRRVLMSKGGPDVLLADCTHVQVGDQVLPLDEKRRADALADVESLSAQALRTLGVAYRAEGADLADGTDAIDDDAEHDLVYLGVVGIIDPPRPEAAVAVREAHRAGVRVTMITGDHPATASRIAADLGIAEPGAAAVTGAELARMDDEALGAIVEETRVFARVAPEHKLRIVDALQARGHVVSMTGDGVNDAPALKSADIGVAMGITGTEVTKEASTMILADDNFATIVAAIRQGRVIFDNIRKFLRFLLSSNLGEVLTVFLGVVLAGVIGLTDGSGGTVVPLLATQILWINLVTDSAPALALGMDPEIDDPMARPPRRPDDRILDRGMWAGILFVGAVMAVVMLTTIDMFLPGGLIEGSDSVEVARTAGFTTLVLAQLFNALNSRSATSSAFHRMFVNPWLWGSIVLVVVLQVLVVEVPFLQTAFGTASMDLAHWAACTGMAALVLVAVELRKLVLRVSARSRRG